MKTVFLSICTLFTFSLFGQDPLIKEKVNFYSCSVNSDTLSSNIMNWIKTNANVTILFSESNKIKVKYTAEAIYTEKKKIKPFGYYSFDVTFLIKDGKIKFIQDNFQHFSQSQYICAGGDLTLNAPNCSSDIITESMWIEFKRNAATKSLDLLSSAELYISQKLGQENIF